MTARPLRVLAICTHNRTRSVMIAALLESMLTERLGADAVVARSSGFGPAGLPAIDDAIEAMARRGIDVRAHRSRATTTALVDGADVIVTAERDHVVRVAALSPDAFARAMTLPELIERATDVDLAGHDGSDVTARIRAVTNGRSAQAYLRAAVPEVADPTGTAPRAFERAVVEIERQCRTAAAVIARMRSG